MQNRYAYYLLLFLFPTTSIISVGTTVATAIEFFLVKQAFALQPLVTMESCHVRGPTKTVTTDVT